jgi:hypothetical protein
MQDALSLTLLFEKGKRYDLAYDKAFDFAYEAEQLTLLAREIPAYTGHPKARERMDAQVARVIPISIKLTPEGWLKIVIPALLPRKERGNQDYIRDNLYPAMERFIKARPPFHFPKSVIVFRHVYNYERPERLYRDHDNIELNAVVNAVALYLLRSDGPQYLEHYYCAARGEADSTEVYLVPQDDFDRFRVALKSGELDPPESKITPL